MGLFTNNKKLCPICGEPTPRLLPTKIEGQAICKTCDKKIDLPNGAERNMTLDSFREYLARYEENQALRDTFEVTYRFDSFARDPLLLDEHNGLLRLKDASGSWAIEKKHLKSFRVWEDRAPLFESGDGTLHCYPSDITDRAQAMRPVVAEFLAERREFERRERMEALHRRNETDEQRRERERLNNLYRPRFEQTELFGGFRVELTLDHPYWTHVELERRAPTFDTDYPSVEDFLAQYNTAADELYDLAVRLMRMIDPAAGETLIGAEPAPAAPAAQVPLADAVNEIKRYKELLDLGVITEEEFAAKRRQLMGI